MPQRGGALTEKGEEPGTLQGPRLDPGGSRNPGSREKVPFSFLINVAGSQLHILLLINYTPPLFEGPFVITPALSSINSPLLEHFIRTFLCKLRAWFLTPSAGQEAQIKMAH